jgi:hypothetical protein
MEKEQLVLALQEETEQVALAGALTGAKDDFVVSLGQNANNSDPEEESGTNQTVHVLKVHNYFQAVQLVWTTFGPEEKHLWRVADSKKLREREIYDQ